MTLCGPFLQACHDRAWVLADLTNEQWEGLQPASGNRESGYHVGPTYAVCRSAPPKRVPYALRDPKIDEKRVLFVCDIDRIATFGEPCVMLAIGPLH